MDDFISIKHKKFCHFIDIIISLPTLVQRSRTVDGGCNIRKSQSTAIEMTKKLKEETRNENRIRKTRNKYV